jgi:transposase
METVFRCCAGMDVHKSTVEVHVRRLEEEGRLWQQTRRWGTMTGDLRLMAQWLAGLGVTHVAMESTGVFWKPIFNILEGQFTVLLVNARHIKQVPGRKTDVRDCQWIAQLLQHGLLRGSFVPERPQRELRDLTRHRTQLVAEKGRVANRIHKTLEDANIKLGAVASDILGVSGRAMLEALMAGEHSAERLAEMAQGRLRGKIPELGQALEGHLTEHHRFLLGLLWKELAQYEELLRELDQRIEKLTRPFIPQRERLSEVPGIQSRVAEVLLAEIGGDVKPFPSARHLTSWAGMCPGNDESAGKRRSGRTSPGNRWLRQALVQAAWAASRTKGSYLGAQYRRLVGRRGKKRALVAVGHSILVIAYSLLKGSRHYHELGADFLDKREPERLTRYLVKRLEGLGHRVSLQPIEVA